MKKTLFNGIPVALMLAALLVGCSQPTDDDDSSSSGGGKAPASDLSYIAFAFGDGIQEIKLANDIILAGNELVVPGDGTLDFTDGSRTIKGLTEESKIILGTGANILFADGQKPVDFTVIANSAKFIAPAAYINANVWVDYGRGGENLPSDAHYGLSDESKSSAKFLVKWEQLVVTTTFDELKEASAEKQIYLFGRDDGKYLALTGLPDRINPPDLDVITKAAGLSVYLITSVNNRVKFDFREAVLNLEPSPNTEIYKQWLPTAEAPESVFYRIGNEAKPTLRIAGSVDFYSGKVNAPGGLVIWGVLRRFIESDAPHGNITTDTTPVTAWTARVNAIEFGSNIDVLGSILNSFGNNTVFKGDVFISGESVFEDNITFENNATFGGPAIFRTTNSGTVDFTPGYTVTFASDVTLHDNVVLSEGGSTTVYGNLSGYPLEKIINKKITAIRKDSVFIIEDKDINTIAGPFDFNVKFLNDVTIGTNAVFNKDATFEKNVTAGNGRPTFGSLAATATETGATTIIRGNATFGSGAILGGTVDISGITNHNVFIGELLLEGGSLSGTASVSLGDSYSPSIVFTGKAADAYDLSIGITAYTSNSDIYFAKTGDKPTLKFTGTESTITGELKTKSGITVTLDKGATLKFKEGAAEFDVGVGQDTTTDASFEISNGIILAGSNVTNGKITANEGILFNIPERDGQLILSNAQLDLTNPNSGIIFAGTGSKLVLKNQDAKLILWEDDAPETGTGSAVPLLSNSNYTGVIIAGSNATNGSVSLVTGSLGVGTLNSPYSKSPVNEVGTFSPNAGTIFVLGVNGLSSTDTYTNVITSGTNSGVKGFVKLAGSGAAAGSAAASDSPSVVADGFIAVFYAD
jgi:hypothetical protein